MPLTCPTTLTLRGNCSWSVPLIRETRAETLMGCGPAGAGTPAGAGKEPDWGVLRGLTEAFYTATETVARRRLVDGIHTLQIQRATFILRGQHPMFTRLS
jgi:hypothetical protein